MASENNEKDPVLSPIQMVDIVGKEPVGDILPLDPELMQEIVSSSNAHSAIVITSTKLEEGTPARFQVASVNTDQVSFKKSLTHLMQVLGNMLDGMEGEDIKQ